jgi:DNA-binding CsgD family transcriptional regulator
MRLASDPAAALTMVGAVTWATDPLGYADEALRIMELALRASPERTAARARACCASAILHDSFGRRLAMRPLMEEALEIGIEVGDKWREAFCLVKLAGDDDRPEAYRAECLDRANRIAEELSDDFLLISIRAQIAGRLETSVAEVRALGLDWQLSSGLSSLALARLAAGDQRGALEAAQEAVRIAANGGYDGFLPNTLEAGAIVVAAGGRPELGLRLAAGAARLREDVSGATVLGRPAGLEQAIAVARTAAGGRASVHEKAGRRADVDSLIASFLEAPAVVADILKPRQREILQLVATGARNREIAERTHLSVRTIEWHLEQLAAQLKVKGRAGLAAWAAANQVP